MQAGVAGNPVAKVALTTGALALAGDVLAQAFVRRRQIVCPAANPPLHASSTPNISPLARADRYMHGCRMQATQCRRLKVLERRAWGFGVQHSMGPSSITGTSTWRRCSLPRASCTLAPRSAGNGAAVGDSCYSSARPRPWCLRLGGFSCAGVPQPSCPRTSGELSPKRTMTVCCLVQSFAPCSNWMSLWG